MVEVAALVGDTARATMLAALMSGQALTASELAAIAHISRPTASGHLAKLVNARLLTVTDKRRFRYFRLCIASRCQYVGKYQDGRRNRRPAAAPAALGGRRGAALCPQLLRPPRRQARRRTRRRAGCQRLHCFERARRRGHVNRCNRALPFRDQPRFRTRVASTAALASTGASGATMSQDISGPNCCGIASSSAG